MDPWGRDVALERIQNNIGRLRVLPTFPAWENEEGLCFHAFAEAVYKCVFWEISWETSKRRDTKVRNMIRGNIHVHELLVFEYGGGGRGYFYILTGCTSDPDL